MKRMILACAIAAGWSWGLPGLSLAKDTLELVETVPVETSLDDPSLRSAHDVWLEMIDGAELSLDLAQFYVSPKEGGTGRLTVVLNAIRRAAARGVNVRLLVDAKFARRYPQALRELDAVNGVQVRKWDLNKLNGGVLHAKYFLVDRRSLYLGSQNFDWRALEHIQELGVRVDSEALAADLSKVFEDDWRRALGEQVSKSSVHKGRNIPLEFGKQTVYGQIVATPNTLLPSGIGSELDRMTQALRGAKTKIRLQLLSYAVKGYDGQAWSHMDQLLRDAAKRGVLVEIMLADWSKKPPKVEAIQALAAVPNISIKFITIPPWSGGHIPFARVVHAKYMTVDSHWSWIGSSNFSGDYFLNCRNVGLMVRGRGMVQELDRWFHRVWVSSYAELVDPDTTYTPPRIK